MPPIYRVPKKTEPKTGVKSALKAGVRAAAAAISMPPDAHTHPREQKKTPASRPAGMSDANANASTSSVASYDSIASWKARWRSG